MGRLSAPKRLYRSHSAWSPNADTSRLQHMTRAELISVVSDLATQVAATSQQQCTPVEAEAGHRPTMLVEGSVRSGQILAFREGDLVVLGSVASGAEIIAGGSIHVYGALRGRAHAGAIGDTAARIFCQKLEAELLAIAGASRISDDIDCKLRGGPAHAWVDSEVLRLASLAGAEGVNLVSRLDNGVTREMNREPHSWAPTRATPSAGAGRSWARHLSWTKRLTTLRKPVAATRSESC
jgi:septum formation inhibitor MinC